MTLDPVVNFGNFGVSTGYDSVTTSITMNSGEAAKMPNPAVDGAFNLTWYDDSNYPAVYNDPNVEIVRVTAIAGDVLTVTRAQEGTSASNKNTGGASYRMILAPTKKTIDDIRNEIMPQYYETRIAEDSGNINISYVGKSATGSLTSSATWQVQRIDETTGLVIEWADGDSEFDNIWDNRESLSYS